MAAKYYTHFLTDGVTPVGSTVPPESHEWSGVVELQRPLQKSREIRELRSLLALNFDLESEDIRILHWARLH